MNLKDEGISNSENDIQDDNPFKATILWKNLISNLKTNVTTKKKRISVCQTECVFSGQSAANAVYTFLVAERSKGSSSIITKHVTRIVANKVCQALLDGSVFIPFSYAKNQGESSPKKTIFSDDDNTFYQFTEEKDFVFPSPAPFKSDCVTRGKVLGELKPVNSPRSLFSNCKSKEILSAESRTPSLVRSRKLNSSDKLDVSLESIDLELITKQAAFRHLLSIIEIPFLEHLVPTHESVQCGSRIDKKLLDETFSSTTETWILIVKELIDSSCFYYDNPIGLSDNQLKRQEYLKLRHYYRDHPMIIVPATFNDIFIAILGLIKQKDLSKATSALQMAVLMLPHRHRIVLQLLLKFMDMVTNDEDQLEDDIDNSRLVLDHFSSIIFNIKLLASSETMILAHFLLLNRLLIFTVPQVIQQHILEFKLKNGIITSDSSYCLQIPESIYKNQMYKESKTALEQLMETIMDSTKISLNEKRKYLKKFKKHHPDIYERCFK